MRVEVRVASPEPAVGVFTTAGTCQGSAPPPLDAMKERASAPGGCSVVHMPTAEIVWWRELL
jgi:hypothetical protein